MQTAAVPRLMLQQSPVEPMEPAESVEAPMAGSMGEAQGTGVTLVGRGTGGGSSGKGREGSSSTSCEKHIDIGWLLKVDGQHSVASMQTADVRAVVPRLQGSPVEPTEPRGVGGVPTADPSAVRGVLGVRGVRGSGVGRVARHSTHFVAAHARQPDHLAGEPVASHAAVVGTF